jgi:hypothetical protein
MILRVTLILRGYKGDIYHYSKRCIGRCFRVFSLFLEVLVISLMLSLGLDFLFIYIKNFSGFGTIRMNEVYTVVTKLRI